LPLMILMQTIREAAGEMKPDQKNSSSSR